MLKINFLLKKLTLKRILQRIENIKINYLIQVLSGTKNQI